MKKYLLLIVAFSVLSCEPPIRGINYDFGEPEESANGTNNVWLRPYLGFPEHFSTIGGTIFTYYCDTLPQPLNVVRSDESSYISVITSKPLASNRTYYWYCEAFVDQSTVKGTCQSEIYSFQTIDTSLLFNRHWSVSYCIKYDEYINQPHNFYISGENRVYHNDEKYYAEIASFDVTKDSVNNVSYIGIYSDGVFPEKGLFNFSYNSVQVINRVFEFINFGMFDDETLELVLKDPNMDYVFIYRSML